MSTWHQAPEYRLLAELEAHFDILIERIEALVDQYRRSNVSAWSLDTPTPDADWLHGVLTDFWYRDGQDGRSTRSYVALIAADEPLMAEVARVNAAKAEFSELLARIREEVPALIAEIKAVLPFRHPALHNHLRGQGLARLHLKQCWRAIPVADAPLSRIRLAWYTSGRSIKKLSVRDAEKKLMALDTDAAHVRIQLKRLAGIPDTEPLAQVQTQAPLMRANLFFEEPLVDGRQRRAMNVALPLFIPSDAGRLPDYNTPPPTPSEKRTRAKRNDERLEETVFLPSLRVFRYKESKDHHD
ncbi:DNA replication terminus site-binding protein [Aidingimonas halophila]|uniref:DNA replication terminus site binding protein n=1 Tax=Aidingimonas halophila TaxID=574349 RepID=A0A1H3D5H5_9GAMM|nr:DNA replication terminus site-binding protein [Aidingimonas halophila]GHC30504.1 hypothetical protein GCM10008094_23530 [Aidingimonas halophila]SDX61661.1 DNA replication terminus site binding protein [Aidingimonas halophila]